MRGGEGWWWGWGRWWTSLYEEAVEQITCCVGICDTAHGTRQYRTKRVAPVAVLCSVICIISYLTIGIVRLIIIINVTTTITVTVTIVYNIITIATSCAGRTIEATKYRVE